MTAKSRRSQPKLAGLMPAIRVFRPYYRCEWSDVTSWLSTPLAALLGVVLTTQVATNTLSGKALGNPYIPAAVNMVIGFFATAILTWSLTS